MQNVEYKFQIFGKTGLCRYFPKGILPQEYYEPPARAEFNRVYHVMGIRNRTTEFSRPEGSLRDKARKERNGIKCKL